MKVSSLREAHQKAKLKSQIYTAYVYILKRGKVIVRYKNGCEIGGAFIPTRCLNCNDPITAQNTGRGRKKYFCKPACGVEYRKLFQLIHCEKVVYVAG